MDVFLIIVGNVVNLVLLNGIGIVLHPVRKWYVAETLVGREAVAMDNLKRQDFSSFCPRYRKVTRHARQVRHILAPVFPGYIFVNLDLQRQGWRSINGTIGVKRLIGVSGSLPQAMPDWVMERLFERCENSVMQAMEAELAPRDVVRFVAGPFADQVAVIDRLDSKGRVCLLFDILGHEAALNVEAHMVAPHVA